MREAGHAPPGGLMSVALYPAQSEIRVAQSATTCAAQAARGGAYAASAFRRSASFPPVDGPHGLEQMARSTLRVRAEGSQ